MEFQGRNLKDPLFNELAKYAGRFAQPVFFGDRRQHSAPFNNGSGFFVCLEGRTLGVTCEHVLDGFRRALGTNPSYAFQFGPVRIDPERYLVAEDKTLDLAVLNLSSFAGQPDGIDSATCLVPGSWPPKDFDDDAVLALAGFPGTGRDRLEADYFRFHAFSAGTTVVASRGPTHFYTRIELEESLVAGEKTTVVENLCGLSGGPVFVWRKGIILTAELVGVVKEYQEPLDLLYVRRVGCIQRDGTLAGEPQ